MLLLFYCFRSYFRAGFSVFVWCLGSTVVFFWCVFCQRRAVSVVFLVDFQDVELLRVLG